MAERRTITHDDFLRIEGLLTLARDHARGLAQIERSLAGLVGEGFNYGATSHVSDALYGGGEDVARADDLLRGLEITVEDPKP